MVLVGLVTQIAQKSITGPLCQNLSHQEGEEDRNSYKVITSKIEIFCKQQLRSSHALVLQLTTKLTAVESNKQLA